MIKGMIVLWSGSLDSIPWGWHLCDGDADTPDLRYKFIMGAGAVIPPGTEGGTTEHTHTFTGSGHSHTLDKPGHDLQAGDDVYDHTLDSNAVGTTDLENHLPPYYTLAFIMKL